MEYVSDPAKPVPFRARPIQPVWGPLWSRRLVDDQREASGRPEVVTFVSEVLKGPVKISGQPAVNLVASTSGTDSDWVVKIIDVWPDEVQERPTMGGFQQMLSADIFRGRYRTDFAKPQPLAPNKPLQYRIRLTFVPTIMFAKPESYVKATQRVWGAPGTASAIELPEIP